MKALKYSIFFLLLRIFNCEECMAIEKLKVVMRNGRIWQRLCSFVKDETHFRLDIDTRCTTNRISLLQQFDNRWSLDYVLPELLRQSRWYSKKGNATLVVFEAKKQPRIALSQCARLFEKRTNLWITASTDRGRCCDGGQMRDPLLLEMHLLSTNGEARRGRFLFREQSRSHSWRSKASRDTSPRLRCFDDRKDVVLPPPAFLVRTGEIASEQNKNKTLLVMHAEGGQGPPEYELRRAVTGAWARDWWQGAAHEAELKVLEERGIYMAIRKQMNRIEHSIAMASARYCLIIEGYAPWTPRLTEAIKHGCVPVLLSPSYRPPFADLLDWSKFSIMLQPDHIESLPSTLLAFDYEFLRRNLDIVRPFFAFCLSPNLAASTSPCKYQDDNALTLLLFQISQRTRWSHIMAKKIDEVHKQSHLNSSAVLALTADELGNDPNDPARASRTARQTTVYFNCIQDGANCNIYFDQQSWQCMAISDSACSCIHSATGV
mmetsp:Transcript_20255/g.30902  ORF Transcript_20255/g.30902 Transcript_20255/m.30902 type:complete len:490 (-) Transcript_20255:66-1535(-)